MNYYDARQRAFLMINQTVNGAKNFPIDSLILKVENSSGFGEKFVRKRLARLSRMNLIIIDIEKDEVTWND